MGLLGTDKRFSLSYQGRGCGGVNLPFDNIVAAREYAEERGATGYQVWDNALSRIVASGARKDCRFKFRSIADHRCLLHFPNACDCSQREKALHV